MNKEKMIENSVKMLSEAFESLNRLPVLNINNLETGKMAVVIVDIINGFINEGVLHDRSISKIIPPAEKLLSYAVSENIPAIAFADSHNPSSAEFSAFPPHCIKGEMESEIVDQLKNIGGYTLIEKNSTNGFHAPDFQKFLSRNKHIENFIICGDCTDICVMNFCLTLKTYFDQLDRKCRVIVPVNMVETFDSEGHSREFMNTASLLFMRNAGIELAGGIDYD